MAVLSIGLFFVGILTYSNTQTLTNLKDLRTYLFTTQGYDKNVRPITDQSQSLDVNVTLYFSGIESLDDVNERMKSVGFLDISWVDQQLTWTPSSYGNIEGIFLSQNDIWKPDLVLQNGLIAFSELGGSFYYVYVTHQGVVTWKPYSVFETRCSIDLTYFPFDRQTCSIMFVVWSHTVLEINLVGGSLVMDDFEKNSIWTLTSSSSSTELDESESVITFTFKLQRKPLFYILNTILPVILLGFLNNVVFLIPADAGEKMGYSVTLFLAFSVFLTIVASEIPKNSEYVSVYSVYMIGELLQSVLIVIISSLQLRLHHRSPEVPIATFYKNIVKLSIKLRCKKSGTKSSRTSVNPVPPEKCVVSDDVSGKEEDFDNVKDRDEVTWVDVSNAIDLIALMTFFLFSSLWTMICLTVSGTSG